VVAVGGRVRFGRLAETFVDRGDGTNRGSTHRHFAILAVPLMRGAQRLSNGWLVSYICVAIRHLVSELSALLFQYEARFLTGRSTRPLCVAAKIQPPRAAR
jgi:hypothetical protein